MTETTMLVTQIVIIFAAVLIPGAYAIAFFVREANREEK